MRSKQWLPTLAMDAFWEARLLSQTTDF